MDEKVPYKFNIINCEKVNSQFNFGEFLEIFSLSKFASNHSQLGHRSSCIDQLGHR